ncbi:MAG: TRAP transporter fused permease subunit, partial [Clostridiales bacterium]|nr:TRAP transporter fused permease subunit [Clostridiales bacterium]
LAKVWPYIVYPVLAIIGVSASYYIYHEATALTRNRRGNYNSLDLLAGAVVIALVLIVTYMYYKLALTCVILAAMAYLFLGKYLPSAIGHPGISIPRIIGSLALYTEGIPGTALGAIVTTVSAILIFAGFLEASGGMKVFMDLALALCGKFYGGAAKVAVVSCALFGMISGSAAANVAATGTVTIPLMEKTGFEKSYAGAITAAAAAGGQIMPPVMGAAAFIIADMLGVGYKNVIVAAIVPAVIFYVAVFMSVDLYSRKNKLLGLTEETLQEMGGEIPRVRDVLVQGGYLLLPVVLLVVLIAAKGMSAQLSALYSTVLVFALSLLRKDTRITPRKLIRSFYEGAMSIIPISVVCAAAGIVMGVFSVTGLGVKLSAYIVQLSGGNLLLLCLLCFVSSIVLGMGLPTVACYLLLATLVVPAMTDFGVLPMAAHMFVFYFGSLSSITPPVAIAAYVAAGMVKCKPVKVGLTACAVALPAFLVPFIFVFQPALLMNGETIEIAMVSGCCIFGTLLFAVGSQGYFCLKLSMPERILTLILSIMLMLPEGISSTIGVVAGAIFLASCFIRERKGKGVAVNEH